MPRQVAQENRCPFEYSHKDDGFALEVARDLPAQFHNALGNLLTSEKDFEFRHGNIILHAQICTRFATLRPRVSLTRMLGSAPGVLPPMVMPQFKTLVDEAKKEIQEIDANQLKKMQNSGEDFSLVDVRDKEDADKGMIPGAVNVSRGMLEYKIDQVTTDPNRKIVLYCGGGSRSA